MNLGNIGIIGESGHWESQIMPNDLYYHIENYQPKDWVGPIKDFAHAPFYSKNLVKELTEAHKTNNLTSKLEEFSKKEDFEYNSFKKFYIKQAIEDFFEKEFKE